LSRVVHYINQFFAGIGGEDAAGTPPAAAGGPVGPGRRLQQLLGAEHEIVGTVWCGDDHAASHAGAAAEALELCRPFSPDLIVAGPAFTSGRYGLSCARLAAAATAAGVPVVAAMHPDNPGLDEAGGAPVVRSGETAREMGPSLETLAAAAGALLAGELVSTEHGRIGSVPRRNRMADRTAAERAVALALARLGGDHDSTEVPLPRFDRVTPAPPVDDVSTVVVALLTEGGLVPAGNPGRLESARATRWLRYPLEGLDELAPGEWASVHGGFSTAWANEDPHRILPLDVGRQLETEGVIGRLHSEYLVTAGNGTSVANARKFGVEWAAELRHSGVRAAVFTST
jgi:glycine reductase